MTCNTKFKVALACHVLQYKLEWQDNEMMKWGELNLWISEIMIDIQNSHHEGTIDPFVKYIQYPIFTYVSL